MQSIAQDLGWKLQVRIWSDSSGARAIASRRGLGKLRHIELKYLWVQEAVGRGRITLKRVAGVGNPADHLTKPMALREYAGVLQKLGARFINDGDKMNYGEHVQGLL